MLSLTAISLQLPSCASPEQAQIASQFFGGALGAATGAVIGHQSGHGIEGALAGALVGGTAAKKLGAAELFKNRQLKFQEAVINGNMRGVQRNFDRKFVNTNLNGRPPLFYAAIGGHDQVASFLIANGANVKYRANDRSLAYHAARSGHSRVAGYLAQNGGGSSSDVSGGSNEYAANQRQIRAQNAAFARVALGLLAASLSQGGGGGGGGCEMCGDPVGGSGRWCSTHESAVGIELEAGR